MRLAMSAVALFRGESGISSVEYALLLAMIGAGLVAAVGLVGANVSTRINTAATTVG